MENPPKATKKTKSGQIEDDQEVDLEIRLRFRKTQTSMDFRSAYTHFLIN